MIKKRMTLSIVTLIGSLFLFVIASFAWFALSNTVDSNGLIIENEDIDVTAVLYDSEDDLSYSINTEISFINSTPGTVKFFKLEVTNNNNFSIYTRIFLYGYSNSYYDGLGNQTNYNEGRELADVTLLNSSNNIDSVTIEDKTISSLYLSSKVVTNDYVTIPAGQTCEFYFSFTIPTSVGNDYQNLMFEFSNIYVSSTKVG